MKQFKVALKIAYCPRCGRPCGIRDDNDVMVKVVDRGCIHNHIAYLGETTTLEALVTIPYFTPTKKTSKRKGRT